MHDSKLVERTDAASSSGDGLRVDADAIRNVADYIRLPLLYRHWYVAATGAEITRKPIARMILEHSIVFYRTESGEPVALQNRCLHRSFPLSESRLVGDELVCRYHGARYASNGTLLRIPCQKGVPDQSLRSYPVREIGPFVFVWMGEGQPDDAVFETLSFLDDPSFRNINGQFEIPASYLLMQENLNDFTHFAFLHHDSFGVEETYAEVAPTIKHKNGRIFSTRVDRDPNFILAALTPPGVGATLVGKDLARYDESHSVSPGVFVTRIWTEVGSGAQPERVLKAYILHLLTPETRDRHRYWWFVSFDHGQDEDGFFEVLPQFLLKGFSEDAAACEEMQRLLMRDKTDFTELNIAGDLAGLQFRKLVLDWLMAEHGAA